MDWLQASYPAWPAVFAGSATKEIGYLKTNVARVRLNTKKREDRRVVVI